MTNEERLILLASGFENEIKSIAFMDDNAAMAILKSKIEDIADELMLILHSNMENGMEGRSKNFFKMCLYLWQNYQLSQWLKNDLIQLLQNAMSLAADESFKSSTEEKLQRCIEIVVKDELEKRGM